MPDALDLRLLNEFQRGFPLEARPFDAVGARVGASADEVLWRYRRLVQDGYAGRIGVAFRPGAAGAGTLAAMAVPPERLEAVAACVNERPEVNHNYERDHRFNLWFVLAAPGPDALAAALAAVERETGLPVLSLPLESEYHIDLGFDLYTGGAPRATAPATARMENAERPLLAAIADGLPLVPEPYAALGRAAGMDAAMVREILLRWLETGVARRFGVIVRHRRLGYDANAMVVWDVPDALVDETGARLALAPGVTLCYRRRRHPPQWRHNLYCMVHGRERAAVHAQVEALGVATGLAGAPREVLFSRRCFRQRGARYATRSELAHG